MKSLFNYYLSQCPMPKCQLTKSFAVKGDIGATFDLSIKLLSGYGFSEASLTWPSQITFLRGNKGLFAKNLKEVKTELKISLNQTSEYVNMFFEYTLAIPSAYLTNSDNEIEKEFLKIKHDLSGTEKSDVPTKVCDVCFTPTEEDKQFCSNCGRAKSTSKSSMMESQAITKVHFDTNKIPFGNKILDDVLYGGLVKNSAVLIMSPHCTEKEIISTRFIETGLENNETVINISCDGRMSQNDKIAKNDNYYNVVCHPHAELEMSPNIAKERAVIVKGVERLTEISVAFTTLMNNIKQSVDGKPRRVVLDIVSDVLLSNQSINTRKWLRETIAKFKHGNFTIVAIMNPYMHSKEEIQALLDIFDGQIELYEKETSSSITQIFMRVKRMNNTEYSNREVSFSSEELAAKKQG